jgi:hypothetical protein
MPLQHSVRNLQGTNNVVSGGIQVKEYRQQNNAYEEGESEFTAKNEGVVGFPIL